MLAGLAVLGVKHQRLLEVFAFPDDQRIARSQLADRVVFSAERLRDHDISIVAKGGTGPVSFSGRCSVKFQGRSASISDGGLPPATAQLSRYQVSQRGGRTGLHPSLTHLRVDLHP